MNYLSYIRQSIKHYKKGHLLILIGIIISSGIVTASLIIGDSVKMSLKQISQQSLGKTQYVITAQNRYFPVSFANKVASEIDALVAPLLVLKGSTSSDKNEIRLPDVQINGINSKFWNIGSNQALSLNKNEIAINKKMAKEMNLEVGDEILIRVEKASFVPLETPFVSNESNAVSIRSEVKYILNANEFGNFDLTTSQITPFNVFIPITQLSGLMFNGEFANHILIPTSPIQLSMLKNKLSEIWTIEDINFHIRELEHVNQLELISDRIFIEQQINTLFDDNSSKQNILTYLVNYIRKDTFATPYSFVTGISNNTEFNIHENEIIINQWLADDLKAKNGDTINLEYYTVSGIREIEKNNRSFIIKGIIAIEGVAADKSLMPAFEGLANVDHCSDWDAAIPIDFDKIRDKDEKYWDDYKGTPKAFISYQKANEIWGNIWGKSTSLRFSDSIDKNTITKKILKQLTPADFGIVVFDKKSEANWSASNAVDFAQLFIGLGFFLIIAALILTALLYSMLMDKRRNEHGIFLSMGLDNKTIRKLLLSEVFFITLIGVILGIGSGILFVQAILYFLNTIWNDIVRVSSIQIFVNAPTIILSIIINSILIIATIWLNLRKRLRQPITRIRQKTEISGIGNLNRLQKYSFYIFIVSILILVGLAFLIESDTSYQSNGMFFFLGFVLLSALLSSVGLIFYFISKGKKMTINPLQIGIKNLVFFRKNNLSTIIILSIGTFIVFAVGLNRSNFYKNANQKTSGTGGYTYYAETSVAVLANMNTNEGKEKYGIEHLDLDFAQLKIYEGDDASCLNLNRIIRPKILGLNKNSFCKDKRFSFATVMENANKENYWCLLKKDLGDNTFPAIADQTVIQWGLGKKIGDSIAYRNEAGDTIHLVLVGGLSNSIFQGHLIVSEETFVKNFPSVSGSKIMLIDNEQDDNEELKNELYAAFRNQGIEVQNAAERLAMFNSVTNTYLDIFLALGGLALILGTIGIAIIIIRNINNLQSTFAAMQAYGVERKQIFRIIFTENIMILIIGVFTGLLAGIVSGIPALQSMQTELPIGLMLGLLAIITINGLFWIYLTSRIGLKQEILPSLRNE